jgi:hypothetical protein
MNKRAVGIKIAGRIVACDVKAVVLTSRQRRDGVGESIINYSNEIRVGL